MLIILYNNNQMSETEINTAILDVNTEEIQKKKIEKKKDVKYPNQRNDVLKRLYQIIGVSPTKPYFRSHEVDFSDEIANSLSELEQDIQQYFNVGSWTVYRTNKEVSKRSLSLVRSILKDMNVKYTSGTEKLINNPNCKFTTIYTITSEIIV